jgi:hypothetical protein
METRVVRLEEGHWRIRTEAGELSDSERDELIHYFGEIKLDYCLSNDHVAIVGSIDRDAVFELLGRFYAGRADVLPF